MLTYNHKQAGKLVCDYMDHIKIKYGIWGEDMKILLIDDDLTFACQLREDALAYFGHDVTVIIETQYRLSSDDDIDAFFITIQSDDLRGFELAQALQEKYKDPLVIFVSNNAELVFKALAIGMFQFIRKELYQEDLEAVFPQLKAELEKRIYSITIETSGRTLTIIPPRIEYFVVINHELIVVSNNQPTVLRSTVKKALNLFHYPYLVQIRRGTVVNLDYVTSVKGHILMIDEKSFTISRKYYADFKSAWKKYHI